MHKLELENHPASIPSFDFRSAFFKFSPSAVIYALMMQTSSESISFALSKWKIINSPFGCVQAVDMPQMLLRFFLMYSNSHSSLGHFRNSPENRQFHFMRNIYDPIVVSNTRHDDYRQFSHFSLASSDGNCLDHKMFAQNQDSCDVRKAYCGTRDRKKKCAASIHRCCNRCRPCCAGSHATARLPSGTGKPQAEYFMASQPQIVSLSQ